MMQDGSEDALDEMNDDDCNHAIDQFSKEDNVPASSSRSSQNRGPQRLEELPGGGGQDGDENDLESKPFQNTRAKKRLNINPVHDQDGDDESEQQAPVEIRRRVKKRKPTVIRSNKTPDVSFSTPRRRTLNFTYEEFIQCAESMEELDETTRELIKWDLSNAMMRNNKNAMKSTAIRMFERNPEMLKRPEVRERLIATLPGFIEEIEEATQQHHEDFSTDHDNHRVGDVENFEAEVTRDANDLHALGRKEEAFTIPPEPYEWEGETDSFLHSDRANESLETTMTSAYFGVAGGSNTGAQSAYFGVGGGPAGGGGASKIGGGGGAPPPGTSCYLGAGAGGGGGGGAQSAYFAVGGAPSGGGGSIAPPPAAVPSGGASTMTALGGAPKGASTMTAGGGAPMGSSTMTAVGGAPRGDSAMTAEGGAPMGSCIMAAVGGAPTRSSTMSAVGEVPAEGASIMTAVGEVSAGGANTMTAVGRAPRGDSTMTAVAGAPMKSSTMTAVGGAPMSSGASSASCVSTMTAVGGAPTGASTMTVIGKAESQIPKTPRLNFRVNEPFPTTSTEKMQTQQEGFKQKVMNFEGSLAEIAEGYQINEKFYLLVEIDIDVGTRVAANTICKKLEEYDIKIDESTVRNFGSKGTKRKEGRSESWYFAVSTPEASSILDEAVEWPRRQCPLVCFNGNVHNEPILSIASFIATYAREMRNTNPECDVTAKIDHILIAQQGFREERICRVPDLFYKEYVRITEKVIEKMGKRAMAHVLKLATRVDSPPAFAIATAQLYKVPFSPRTPTFPTRASSTQEFRRNPKGQPIFLDEDDE